MRIGPSSLRAVRSVHRRGRHPRARAHGDRRGRRGRRVPHPRRRSRGHPLQRVLRVMLDVRAGSPIAMRDDAGSRSGHGCCAPRVHQALRAARRRPGGAPAGAASPVRADPRPRGPARRAVPLPLRCAAHGVAGSRLCRRPPRRVGRGLRARSHRPDERAHRPAPGGFAGHRAGRGSRTPRDGTPPRGRCSGCAGVRRPRGPAPRAHVGARPGLRHRRRRHGSHRLWCRQGRPGLRRPPPRCRGREADGDRRHRSPGRRCWHRSTWSAEVERSPSSGSTAA